MLFKTKEDSSNTLKNAPTHLRQSIYKVRCTMIFIYLFIYLRICTNNTGAKTIGYKSPPRSRSKHQPNPLLKF